MTRLLLAGAVCLGLLAAPAAQAVCSKNGPKPTTVEGAKVKKGSCGPWMMKVDEYAQYTVDAYYECSDAKGKTLKALYKDCKQVNAKKAKKSAN